MITKVRSSQEVLLRMVLAALLPMMATGCEGTSDEESDAAADSARDGNGDEDGGGDLDSDADSDSDSDTDTDADADADADTDADADADSDADADGDAGFSCANGENDAGQGCFLPCENGWHPGSDGRCHIDCMSFLAENDAGACMDPVCAVGWTRTNLNFVNDGGVYDIVSVCVKDCPDGWITQGPVWNRSCLMPCGDGWHEGSDSRCHLDCPDGSVESDASAGCSLIDVGERKPCPLGLYDESFTGTNPIYVDVNDTSPTPDGTKANPFHSIADAVAAGGSAMTIYVAAGEYEEQVILDGQDEVNLIGACAQEVHLVGEGLGNINDVSSGVINATDVDTLIIDGFAITSDLRGIRVDHSGNGTSLVIRNVRVDSAAYVGIGVYGQYDTAAVTDNTVSESADVGICLVGNPDEESIVPGTVEASRNEIHDLVPCTGLPICGADPYIMGIVATDYQHMLVSKNHARGFEYADAIIAYHSPDIAITNNIIEDLQGSSALFLLSLPDDAVADIQGNRIAKCQAGPWGGNAATEMYGIIASHENDAPDAGVELNISNNYFNEIQGYDIFFVPTYSNAASLNIQGNDFEKSPIGAMLQGRVTLLDNRFYDLAQCLFTQPASPFVHVEGNECRDSTDDDFDLPPGPLKSLLEDDLSGVSIRCGDPTQPLVFKNNRISGWILQDPYSNAVTVTNAHEALVSDNVFEDNDTCDVFFSNLASLTVSGNRFQRRERQITVPYPPLESHSAMQGLGNSVGEFANVAFENNYFEGYMNGAGIKISYVGEVGNFSVKDNVALQVYEIMFDNAQDLTSGVSLSIEANDFLAGTFQFGPFTETEISGNRFLSGAMILLSQEAGTATQVQDNVFWYARMAVRYHEGRLDILNNEFHEPSFYGIGQFSSDGDVTILSNIINGVFNDDMPGVGIVGDGIMIVGTAEDGYANAEIYGNRIHEAGRVGLLVHGSYAMVQGNMYTHNGGACGPDCDFVIQSPISADAVTGWDTGFATIPAEPYGVITADGPF